ncbi:MAG TPA: hypothetical protein VN818_00495 [Gammaproteobacteria bacterium]|nr:hypothetical protein [Gammaproteobacteria bacterium]
MRSVASLLVFGSSTLLAVGAAAQTTTSEGGYDVTRSQTVTEAPSGYVGRKTTDRETRVGKTAETDGNSSAFVMTVGGFVRECPSAEGLVAGNFEYSLTGDDVNTDEGETRRTHNAVSLVASLEGHVRDDGIVDYVTVDGDFTRQREGTPAEQQHIQRRFSVGATGQPDFAAMEDAVTATADLSIAVVMWMGSTLYTQAQTHWNMLDACAEFAFEPATRTRAMGPNQSTDVRVTLRTKDDKAPIGGAEFRANALAGIGTLTPHEGRTEAEAPISFKYTTSANPTNAHGFDVAARSRAGIAGAEWHILAATPFEGTFTQTRTMNAFGASLPAEARALGAERYGVGASATYEITGRLRWAVEEGSTRPSSFGDLGSVFYVPTGGEITVNIRGDGRSMAGACTHEGSRTFNLAELPREATQYLVLEIGGDGRYKLWLAMVSYYLRFKVQGKCDFRGGQRTEQTLDVNDAGLVLTQQEGVVTNDAVAGQTAAPIVQGYDRYEGRWEFRKLQPQP